MSDRPIDIDLTKNTELTIDKTIPEDPTPEEIEKFRARNAQVLDRTMTVDWSDVKLPDHVKGYWCPNDPLSKAQAELRGFQIDTVHARKNSLHESADGTAVIADVIFMTRPTWMHDVEKNNINNRYRQSHLEDRRRQKEEKDFLQQNEMPAIVRSNVDAVSGHQIEETLSKKS